MNYCSTVVDIIIGWQTIDLKELFHGHHIKASLRVRDGSQFLTNFKVP